MHRPRPRWLAAPLAAATAVLTLAVPAHAAGNPPNPSIVATPAAVLVGQPVTFDLHLTNDPDGDLDHCLVNAWDGTPDQTVPCSTNPTHVYTTPGTYTPAVDAFDAAGNHAFNFGRVDVVAPRFPGDPGPGRIMLGLNDVNGWAGVQAQMPRTLGLHRVYNSGNWGVPTTKVQAAITAGQIPWVSWGFGTAGVQAITHAQVVAVCTTLASFKPHPLWVVDGALHEPENDLTTPAQQAAFRALGRDMVTTCDAQGADNVTWTAPTYMNCTFSGGCAGRDWRAWYADWNGGNSGTSADFYTGAARVLDVDAMDVYVPLIGSNTWTATARQLDNMLSAMTADGHVPLPPAIAEWGVKSDTVTPDLGRGPAELQAGYDALLARGAVGASLWTTGGDSFCHGPAPASDPQCLRELKLAQLAGDPRTVTP